MTDDLRRRLIQDPGGVSYGAAEMVHFSQNLRVDAPNSSSAKSATKSATSSSTARGNGMRPLDPERAARVRRSASFAHRRKQSHQFSRQRMRTKFEKGGPDFVGDFKLIDWMNEDSRYLEREVNETTSMTERLVSMYIVLTMTGVGTGLMGAFLDSAVDFFTSLRNGICLDAFYLTEKLCCLTAADECLGFYRWNHLLESSLAIDPNHGMFLGSLFFACLYGFVAAWLVKTLAPYASGSGIPEIKAVLNGVVMRGYLSAWTLVVKVIGLVLSVAAGLNLGKEGPVVHLASCIAFLVADRFKLFRYDQQAVRQILSCACAAGVATAFGAPIGGILFAFEEASTFFPNHVLWRAFYCAAAAAIVLKMSNPFFNNHLVLFEVTGSVKWLWFELVPIALIGLAGGFIGHLWINLNLLWMKTKLRSPVMRRSPIWETFALVVLTLSANWMFPFMWETNSSILRTLFNGCSADRADVTGNWSSFLCSPERRWELVFVMLYGMVQKFLLSALTFGSRVPAGLFIPSLTIGALFGTLTGVIVHQMTIAFPNWSVFQECGVGSHCAGGSVYAIAGAAAVLAGVTQVSVSLSVIVLELTGQLSLLLPMMIVIFLAKVVTNVFGTPSIYDSYIHMRRYPYLEPEAQIEHSLVNASEIMRSQVIMIPATNLTVEMLEKLYRDTEVFGFPIVTDMEQKLFTGYLSRMELKVALQTASRDSRITGKSKVVFGQNLNLEAPLVDDDGNVDFGKYCDFFVAMVQPTFPLSKVFALMERSGIHGIVVIDKGAVVGIISRKDLIAFIDLSENIPRKYFL